MTDRRGTTSPVPGSAGGTGGADPDGATPTRDEAASSPPLRLEARGLSKSYGSIAALSDVNFELRAGEVMALLGENGAGKSTLVKTLAGLVKPDGGTIAMDGEPTELFPSSRSQDAGIAVVHQEFSSVRPLSVAENLVLGDARRKAIWTASALATHARPILDSVGLGHVDPHTPVERLSVAETQLVEVARAVAKDARVVIFDEPTAALSDHEIERVLDLIRQLAAQGRSIVYVTHRLPEVFELADRVTIIRNGRSMDPVPIADLDVGGVISMMLGRKVETMFPARTTKTDDVALRIEGLRTPGLDESVDLTVHRGEIVGLVGQLGSGATDVVRAVAGLLDGTTGNVEVNGAPLSLRRRRHGIDRGVAYCSPDRKVDGMFLESSIEENLSAPWLHRSARLGWVARAQERQKTRAIASRFAIDVERMRSTVGTLSGGNQQKVVLGKWLGLDLQVLLVEEPTRGVDVGARAEVYQRLRELCAEGLAIVVVSSDTEEVLGLCDTIATFYHGRLQANRPWTEWDNHSLTRGVMHSEVAA